MGLSEKSTNYNRIATAIKFIIDNQLHQPSLDEIANHINLSPFHFQRLFQEWAGTTPKKFLQYISLEHAKKTLKQEPNLLSTSQTIGLSSPSRLHELFVKIEGMTPEEYKNEGYSLDINYSIQESLFGQVIIASTSKGICQINFLDEASSYLETLTSPFPQAKYTLKEEAIHLEVIKVLHAIPINKPINIHIKGTSFQLKVWEALLKIPIGNLQSYGQIAKTINQPTASRAVGTAIGANPLAFLIPCHRVIQASGIIGGYMWNPIRKKAIIGWESANINGFENESF